MSRPPKKLPVRRLFTGVAGSPLAQVVSEPRPEPPAMGQRGRPRKYEDDTARQRACRSRKADTLSSDAKEQRWRALFREHSDYKGRLHGEISGGFATAGEDGGKLSLIDAAITTEGLIGGKRVHPSGFGYESFERLRGKSSETAHAFQQRHAFPKTWKLTDQEQDWIVERLARQIFKDQDDSFICELCGVEIMWFRDTIRHMLTGHSADVKKRILEDSPHPVAGPKRSKCSLTMHKYWHDKLAAAGETAPVECKHCRKMIYTPNIVTKIKIG